MKLYKMLLIVIVILISSCATAPVCRHTAVLAALTMGEKYPVRLMYGMSNPWQDHVQAQAYIDNKWEWLEVELGLVYVGKQEKFNATLIMTPSEFINSGWTKAASIEFSEKYKALNIK